MKQAKDFQKQHRTEWEEFLWEALIDKITNAQSGEQVKQVLNTLFSDSEKEKVVKRIAAQVLIRAGKGYKEIGEILWLSHATISAHRKNLLEKSQNYKSQRAFKTGNRSDAAPIITTATKTWLDDFFDSFNEIDLWELLKNPPRPPGTGLKNHIL
jgi:Trp operon repressor